MTSTLKDIANVLDKSDYRDGKSSFMASCPAHDDKKPSLQVTEKDGRILLYCFSGCDYKDVNGSLRQTCTLTKSCFSHKKSP